MTEFGKYIPVSEAQNRLWELIRELEECQKIVTLTRGGDPAAVLLSVGYFRGLLETVEILGDFKALGSLKRSLKQAECGEWVSSRDVFERDSRKTAGRGESSNDNP